jgi:hypothetical protein
MSGASLIGNSTYPADEHNLQTLKGPVKDITVLNRALADPVTGLFADTDVTLLPEVTSARAIRAMGRFFGDAARDDVLLFYFSGHGKLDQVGRLHLCMQDTESTALLATAVSSARISEFADASHARNVVIVLDCCFSGAFRGGELGDAVAGPGRYVMTSCRGTQLANDATVENSTSHFTQSLVDGLTSAVPALPRPKAGTGDVPPGPREPRHGGPWRGRNAARRPTLLIAAAVAIAAAGGTIAGVLLTQGKGSSPGGSSPTVSAAFTYTAPWQLKVSGEHTTAHDGCSVSVIDAGSGTEVKHLADNVYGTETYQVSKTGTFRWRVNDPTCLVATYAGSGSTTLPLVVPPSRGDTAAFPLSSKVSVTVTDWGGSPTCDIGLWDPASGTLLDFGTADQAKTDTVLLDPGSHKSAYLAIDGCGVHVSAVT